MVYQEVGVDPGGPGLCGGPVLQGELIDGRRGSGESAWSTEIPGAS